MGTPPSLINLYGNSTSRLSGGILFFVERYVNHPQYRTIRLSTGQVIWDYDVSVIEVDHTNPLDGVNIRPTILPATCGSACCGACEGTVITIAGWGKFKSSQMILLNTFRTLQDEHTSEHFLPIFRS